MECDDAFIEKHLPLAQTFDLSAQAQRDLIVWLTMALQARVDIEFGIDPTQAALSNRQKAFQQAAGYDSLSGTRTSERDDLDIEGATDTQHIAKESCDEARRPSQGSGLHPRI